MFEKINIRWDKYYRGDIVRASRNGIEDAAGVFVQRQPGNLRRTLAAGLRKCRGQRRGGEQHRLPTQS